ncbi:MAG: POTRA domain-containing protein, partial [Acidobacteriota bacterium]
MGHRSARVLFALALWGAARGAAAASPDELLGRTIESVAITSDGPFDRSEIQGLISLDVGRALTESATADTIRNLFGTLRFSNVRIQAEPSASGGVAVTIHLWRAFRVRAIQFHGKTSLSGEELRRAIPFAEGDPFDPSPLAAGAASIERRLTADGYLHPAVDPEAIFDYEAVSVTVVYRIEAGQRALVAAPFFDGETRPFTAEALEREGKIRENKPYREARAKAAAERIRKFLLEQGYFRANVELIAAEPTEAGTLRGVYRITVGPLYQIQAAGMKIKQARREILSLLAGQSFDEDLLEVWAENHTQELQRAGHYRATVAATAAPGPESVVVAISVEPGPKYAIERVSISGNAAVDEETLRALMITRKKGLPVVQKGRLIDANLDGDVSAILGYYQTHGWIDARVEKPAVTDGSKPGLLAVGITVVEGPRTYVAQRRVEGAEHLTAEELDKLVAAKVGDPLNPTVLRQDVGSLTTHYWNTGWREASVVDGTKLSEDRKSADVLYRVTEGARTFFGKTVIRGNAVTDPARIRRQVAWKEGEPFSQEKVADTQQNL